jgi:hypothetical protein
MATDEPFSVAALRKIRERGKAAPRVDPATSVSLADFRAYMPAHSYLFAPTRGYGPLPASMPVSRPSLVLMASR